MPSDTGAKLLCTWKAIPGLRPMHRRAGRLCYRIHFILFLPNTDLVKCGFLRNYVFGLAYTAVGLEKVHKHPQSNYRHNMRRWLDTVIFMAFDGSGKMDLIKLFIRGEQRCIADIVGKSLCPVLRNAPDAK